MIGVPLAIGVLGAVLLLWRVVVPALSASSWTPAAPLPMALSYHSATQLQDGRVLVAGGYDSQRIYAAAFVFTPDGGGGRWQPVAPMHLPRVVQTATLLPDGRVLVAGGARSFTGTIEFPGGLVETATAEIYDPRTDTWSLAEPMATARADAVAIGLGGGYVLVTGGFTPAPGGLRDATEVTGATELFDPGAGRWTATGSLSIGRSAPEISPLPGGRVMVAGGGSLIGRRFGYLSSVETYDPATGRWAEAAHMSVARSELTLTPLPDGRVVALGGLDTPEHGLSTGETYDPRSNRWTGGPDMAIKRSGHTATALADGRVLVIGGLLEGSLATTSVDLLSAGGAR